MKLNPQQLTTASFFNEWTATILIQNEYNKVQILYYIFILDMLIQNTSIQFAFTDYHFIRKRQTKWEAEERLK